MKLPLNNNNLLLFFVVVVFCFVLFCKTEGSDDSFSVIKNNFRFSRKQSFEYKVTVHYGLGEKYTQLWPLNQLNIIILVNSSRGCPLWIYFTSLCGYNHPCISYVNTLQCNNLTGPVKDVGPSRGHKTVFFVFCFFCFFFFPSFLPRILDSFMHRCQSYESIQVECI